MKIKKRSLCRLCFTTCDKDVAEIEELSKDVLDMLLLKLNIYISEERVICKNCMGSIQKCFYFKSSCFHTENFIAPLMNSQDKSKLDIRDVYIVKNKLMTAVEVPEDQKICRLCMKLIKNIFFKYLIEIEEDMIQKCIPELDFNLTMAPVVCDSCFDSLKHYFLFLKKCFDIEEHINIFKEVVGKSDNGQIELNEVLQFTQKQTLGGLTVNINVNIADQDGMCCEIKENALKTEIKVENADMMKSGIGEKVNDGEINMAYEENVEVDYAQLVIKKEENYIKTEIVKDIMRAEINENFAKIEDKEMKIKYEQTAELAQFNIEKDENCIKDEVGQDIIMNPETSQSCLQIEGNDVDVSFEQNEMKNKSANFESFQEPLEKITMESGKMCSFQPIICSFSSGYKSGSEMPISIHEINSPVMTYECENPSQITMYDCELCSYKTKHKWYLKNHMLIHTHLETSLYNCNTCTYKTNVKSYLKGHMLKHKNGLELTMYKCDVCTYETKIKRNHTRHTLIHQNPALVTIYKCETCVYQTKHKRALKKHTLTHTNPTEIKMCTCEICKCEFKYKQSLNRHMLVHKDPSELTMYTCKVCTFSTKRRRSLRRHMLTHTHPPKITMYKCEMCTYEVRQKKNFHRHMSTHKKSSEKSTYSCDVCTYETKNKTYFKRHIVIHKNPSEIMMYNCKMCTFRAKTKVRLRQHMFIHKSPSERKIYKCEMCTFSAKHPSNLSRHLWIHKSPLEVTMYKCDMCPYETKEKMNLKRHMLVHKKPSEILMYKCEMCTYSTKYQGNITRHMVKHKNS